VGIGRWLRRFEFWWRRDQLADELQEELETHRLLRQEVLERAGDSASDAVAGSRRALGGALLAREEARAVWVVSWIESLAQDLRFALRTLRRRPGLAAAAIVTIAMGTGILASILSVADTALLRGAPYPNADRIVQIGQVFFGRNHEEVSMPDVRALREGSASLSHVTIAWFATASLAGGDVPDSILRVYTDSHAFAMLGVMPLLGRLPTLADDDPGASAVVVLSYDLWRNRFGARRDIVGQTLRIDSVPHTVIAVMPPVFRFPAPYWARGDVWSIRGPSHPSWPDTRSGITLAFGLLRDGATIERAQAEADAIAAMLDQRYPNRAGHVGLSLTTWAATIRSASRPRVFMLIAAVGLLFVLVCANVANLLVSQGLDRRRELAARVALGAGRARLIRQLLTETAVLFVAGGLGGLAIALWGTRLLVTMQASGIPGLNDAALGLRAAATGFVVTIMAALIVGMIPAVQAATTPMSALTSSTRDSMPVGAWQRLQGVLIAAEIALALMLLCGAAVLVDGARRLARVDPGFDADGLLHARVVLAERKYVTREQQVAFYASALERLRAIPGVSAVAVVDIAPGTGAKERPALLLDTDPPVTPDTTLRLANVRAVSTSYFDALRIAHRTGRFFDAADDAAPVAIVNQSFVRRYLRDTNPIGRSVRVTMGRLDELDQLPRAIIGVVADVKDKSLFDPAPPVVYIPLAQSPWRMLLRMSLLVRSPRPDGEMAQEMRRAIAQIDPEQAVTSFMAMGDLMRRELALNQLTFVLLSILSIAAVFLAVIGVYGVMAYAARRRMPEIGIRVALGATYASIVNLLMRTGGLLALCGVAAGAVLAVWSTRLLGRVLQGVDHSSPWTFVCAGALLSAAVLIACYLPARRAARGDILLRL
jgi:putative ABC transport system permease protein